MSDIRAYIAEIGLNAVKDKIKDKLMEAEARKKLDEFLQRQDKLNFNCTREEEIDFEGLADYIRRDLIDDVKDRLFGDKSARGIAHKSIVRKAVYYAQSNTRISKQRATTIVNTALNILREFYESKANRELSYYAGRIEDTLSKEMSEQHEQQLQTIIKEISKQTAAEQPLSPAYNVRLAASGKYDTLEDNVTTVIEAINTKHPLKPYYGYSFGIFDGKYKMVSIPLLEEAENKYPPKFQITATDVHVGKKHITELPSLDIFDYSYRHQLPIALDVLTAKKLLGDISDPYQAEAKIMEGGKIIITPPKFPEAFPCSISVNNETVFDYLPMRTKEILEDGTVLVTNEEQVNRSFDIIFSINQNTKEMRFNIRSLNPSNPEKLSFRKFVRSASTGAKFAIKALSLNAYLGVGNMNPFVPSSALDAEIEFLEKIVTIEQHFRVNMVIPEEISIEDHQVIDYVYDIIHLGSFTGHWSDSSVVFEISDNFKERIAEMEDKVYKYTHNCMADVELFDQQLTFPIKRELKSARFKDLAKIKQKTEVLDIGDTITLNFIPDETIGDNAYIDTFAKDDEIPNE